MSKIGMKIKNDSRKNLLHVHIYSLYILLIYGLILNIGWFFSSIKLQKIYFNRNFIITIFIYLVLISYIISKFYRKDFVWTFYIKSLCYMSFCLIILVISYIFLLAIGFNDLLSYAILILIYSFLMSIILSRINFIKINYFFYIWQALISLINIFCFIYLLDGIQTYFYGLQFLFSTWIFFMTLYLVSYKIHSSFDKNSESTLQKNSNE